MKVKNILSTLAIAAGLMLPTACEDEKDLIIIEGNLPIKTTTLFMVGDATPNGWSIDAPTPFAAEGEDPLVFTWEGNLNTGEMKLCLVPGSWDAPFIRPMENGTEINSTDVADVAFQMHAGDPDEKWRVTEAGTYLLTFDLRHWTMSTTYKGGVEAPAIEPIVTENLYIVGDATPNGWNIDDPTALQKTGDFIFEYDGVLNAGEMKACTSPGSWDVNFVRPESDGCAIGKDGVASETFVYTANPDNKWKVAVAGVYHLTFDLEHYTVKAEFKEEIVVEKTPIETATLFMIGDATPGGWSMDDATELTVDPANKYVFSWEGELVGGSLKLCTERDPSFSCPFIRPSSADVVIDANGVSADDFVYTTGPDDQWRVAEAGTYRLVFDLENYTIKAEKVNGGGDEPVVPGDDALATETLFLIGSATAGGWSMDALTPMTKTSDYVFTWEGELGQGELKACVAADGTFSCPFVRPAQAGVRVDENGASASAIVYSTEPDDQWSIAKVGRYNIVFDLKNWTAEFTYIPTETPDDDKALKTSTLYLIGDATPGGWSMDNLTALTQSADNKYIFTWEGKLGTGEMKACLAPDGTFSCPFVRPASSGVEINENGVTDPAFVYTTDPDDKWRVTKAGTYRLTFDVLNWTVKAEFKN